jgi:hypothetical protein
METNVKTAHLAMFLFSMTGLTAMAQAPNAGVLSGASRFEGCIADAPGAARHGVYK